MGADFSKKREKEIHRDLRFVIKKNSLISFNEVSNVI